MRFLSKSYAITPFIGLVIVLPFFILEWVTTSGFIASGFPSTLFIFMWINSIALIAISLSVLEDIQKELISLKNIRFLFKVTIFGVLSWALIDIIIDQMPCFLGGSGC